MIWITTGTTSASTGNVITFPARGLFSQRDLFLGPSNTPTSTGIVGLIVRTPERPCRTCGAVHFIIGSSAAMHCARLTCAECGAFAGWMSKGNYRYACMSVDKFGRPTEAITVCKSEKED